MIAQPSHQVLMVDDEPNILTASRRTLGRQFNLACAASGMAALELIRSSGPFAVVLTDMRMPEMDGLAFINAARAVSPDSVYMMLTGNADQQTAVNAINQGHIFRFLNKPCPPEVVADALRSALAQYDLVTAERVLLRQTLTGSLRLMVEALGLVDPQLGVLQSLTKHTVAQVCKALKIECDWTLAIASTTCLVGLVAAPRGSGGVEVNENALVEAAAVSSKLIRIIPRMNPVAALIERQRQKGNLPDNLEDPAESETIGAQLLRYAVDLALVQRTLQSQCRSVTQLLHEGNHDPRLLRALHAHGPDGADKADQVIEIETVSVRPGMVLVRDMVLTDGRCLLAGGQQLSDLAAASIRSYAFLGRVPQRIVVRLVEGDQGA
jgi:CheY-like chemotaxis protein